MKLKTSAFAFIGMTAMVAGPALAETNIIFGNYSGPESTLNAEGIIPWLDAVKEASGGDLATQFVGGGALVKTKTGLFAIKDGLVDGLFLPALYYPAELPVSNLFVKLGAVMTDPMVSAAALSETVAFDCPACDEEFAQWNIKSLGSWVSPPYDLMCTKPVDTLEGMNGLRIRASGHAVTLAGALGATAANFTITETYEALQRNQVDCSLGNAGWLTTYSLGEAAKFVVDVNAGAVASPTVIGLRADLWSELTTEQRQLFIDKAPIAISGVVFGYSEQEAATLADEAGGYTVLTPEAAVTDALAAQAAIDAETAASKAIEAGVTSAPEIVEAFLANYKKWEGLISGDETREEYAALLAREIYDRMSAE